MWDDKTKLYYYVSTDEPTCQRSRISQANRYAYVMADANPGGLCVDFTKVEEHTDVILMREVNNASKNHFEVLNSQSINFIM